MDRKKLKEKAKGILAKNIWDILTPFIILGLIEGVSGLLFGAFISNNNYQSLFSSLITLACLPISFGSTIYVMNVVRGKNHSIKDIFNYYPNFFYIFGLAILTEISIMVGFVFLIIPAFIISIGFTMSTYIMADGVNDPVACLKQSWKMMKGYKSDFFIFELSFILWYLSIILTFGLSIFYVGPYVSIANILYYDELKKIS